MSTKKSWRIPPVQIAEKEISESFSADVIVIGLGHAGTPAVRAAAEEGASVIAIEKMAEDKHRVWGNDIGHINSKFLESKGVPKVDPIDFFNEWMRRSGNRANPGLVMQYCQKCGEAFDWFTKPFTEEQIADIQVTHWPPPENFTGELAGQSFWVGTAQFSGMFRKGNFPLNEAVKINQQYAGDLGARLHFGMDAQQLLMDGDRVTGVIASNNNGKYIRYNAIKGVVLAAGDFGGNEEMCFDLLPDIVSLFDNEKEKFQSSGRDGRGIQLGVWAGGRIEPLPLAIMSRNFPPSVITGGFLGSLCVNENGNRFCNEAFGDPVFTGFPGLREKSRKIVIFFDSRIKQDLQNGTPAHLSFDTSNDSFWDLLEKNLTGAREAGKEGYNSLSCAETLEELADYLGFNDGSRKNLFETVKRYNELCVAGRDEDFGKDKRFMNPLNTPPFYAREQIINPGGIMVTLGGLMTDENQNVLNQKKDPIPGLYATGNCCGRRWGLQYSTPIAGVSISMAMTMGREVGRIVAGAMRRT